MINVDTSPRKRVLLAAISLTAAAPMLYMAVHHRIDYDSWWHVFIAREVPWARFWRDVYHNAHPPVFYLLLRAAAWLGSERLVYRALSIVAAVVATYAVGRIGTRVFRTPAVSLVCALAFGLAMTTVIMATAVRSYMLSVALMLLAFPPSLDLVDPRHGRVEAKTRILFVVAVIGAIITHYAAIFFACAAAALPCLYAAVDGRYRTWWRQRLRTRWRDDMATIVPIAAVVVAVYSAHMSRWDAPMVHTSPFYPDQLEWAAGVVRGSISFLSRSVVAEIDLFSPLPIAHLSAAARAIAVSVLAVLAAGLVLTLRHRADWVVASAPLATLALLATAMMGAALAGRYPFGGFLRHQFILFPFVVLSAFSLVDEIVARLHRRRLALAVVCAAIVLKSALQWRQMQFVADETGAQEIVQFNRSFGDSRAVYVDQFSLIPFFAVHQRGAWASQTGVGEKFVALTVLEPERTLLVLRDMTRWSCDLSDRQLYRDLRQLIELTQLPSVDLFRLRQGAQLLSSPPRPERAQLTESILQLAESEDLHVERLVLDGFHVYARFRLADGHGTAPIFPARPGAAVGPAQ